MNYVFATVNMERVLSETHEGKRIIDQIRQREEPKKKEFQQIVNDIVALREKYQGSGAGLPPEESLRVRQNIEQKELAALRFQETTLKDLENYRLETMAQFEKMVFPIIDRISKSKNITMLFPYPQRWIIYSDPSVDITDEVIEDINRSLQSSSSARGAANLRPADGGQKGPAGTQGKFPKGNVKV